MIDKNVLTVDRTPNPNCEACATKRLHSEAEYREFHPYGGCGYTREGGWMPPELAPPVTESKVKQNGN